MSGFEGPSKCVVLEHHVYLRQLFGNLSKGWVVAIIWESQQSLGRNLQEEAPVGTGSKGKQLEDFRDLPRSLKSLCCEFRRHSSTVVVHQHAVVLHALILQAVADTVLPYAEVVPSGFFYPCLLSIIRLSLHADSTIVPFLSSFFLNSFLSFFFRLHFL
ncbi:hypothetical protein AMTRI_Chr13g125980 [Amborella trichopoda]